MLTFAPEADDIDALITTVDGLVMMGVISLTTVPVSLPLQQFPRESIFTRYRSALPLPNEFVLPAATYPCSVV